VLLVLYSMHHESEDINCTEMPSFVSSVVPVSSIIRSERSDSLKADSEIRCKICGTTTKLKTMRAHVGGHILNCLRPPADEEIDDETKQYLETVRFRLDLMAY
jgi:hypothetical protein